MPHIFIETYDVLGYIQHSLEKNWGVDRIFPLELRAYLRDGTNASLLSLIIQICDRIQVIQISPINMAARNLFEEFVKNPHEIVQLEHIT